jgi:hypothetical protein
MMLLVRIGFDRQELQMNLADYVSVLSAGDKINGCQLAPQMQCPSPVCIFLPVPIVLLLIGQYWISTLQHVSEKPLRIDS